MLHGKATSSLGMFCVELQVRLATLPACGLTAIQIYKAKLVDVYAILLVFHLTLGA